MFVTQTTFVAPDGQVYTDGYRGHAIGTLRAQPTGPWVVFSRWVAARPEGEGAYRELWQRLKTVRGDAYRTLQQAIVAEALEPRYGHASQNKENRR